MCHSYLKWNVLNLLYVELPYHLKVQGLDV